MKCKYCGEHFESSAAYYANLCSPQCEREFFYELGYLEVPKFWEEGDRGLDGTDESWEDSDSESLQDLEPPEPPCCYCGSAAYEGHYDFCPNIQSGWWGQWIRKG